MTWGGPRRRADVARGTTHGCNVALRPRGRATAGPREAQVALTRGRRPRGWVHADAYEGCHVACGFAYGGPTGIVGPWLGSGGGNTKALHRPLFYTRYSFPSPPCGTMVPRSLTFAGHVAAQRTSDARALMEICRCGRHGVHPIAI